MSLLEIDGVDVFIGGRAILRRVSLRVERGERVALVGPNGIGKSTLLRVVLGLRAPDAGRVRVLGGDPPARDVGFVPQDPGPSLLPWLSVRDNVLLPLRIRNAGAAETERALASVRELLDPHSEIDLAAHPPGLSGGERQLVTLMRGLSSSPRLLLCDEPFSAMDAPARARLRESLRRMSEAEDGPALLFTTHDLDDMIDLATRVVVIEGRPASIERTLDPSATGARRAIGCALAEARR